MLLTNQKTINYEKFTLHFRRHITTSFFASAKVLSLLKISLLKIHFNTYNSKNKLIDKSKLYYS